MKFTFFGTGAGEKYPGLWCECENCMYAREHRGRNLRGNSSALIDGDIMLDANESSYKTSAGLGISLARVTALMVTHVHRDHFLPHELMWRAMSPEVCGKGEEERRHMVSPRFTDIPMLTIYGNRFVEQELEKLGDITEKYAMRFERVYPGRPVKLSEDTEMIPVAANHGPEPGFAFSYIIKRGGKCVLYALDTGGYELDMLDLLADNKYDLIVMEGTFGLGCDTDPGHMALSKNRKMIEFFASHDCFKGGIMNLYLTHMAPHWTPPHDIYSEMLRPEGIKVAYDGLSIDV